MKILFLLIALIPVITNAQKQIESEKILLKKNSYIKAVDNL